MMEDIQSKELTFRLSKCRATPNLYRAKCLSGSNNPVGYATFQLKENYAVLYNIWVKPKYREMHIGKTLLAIMENFAKENRVFRVEGKFYPSADGVRDFYEKCGYDVPNKEKSWENYDKEWTLSKDLRRATDLTTERTNER